MSPFWVIKYEPSIDESAVKIVKQPNVSANADLE
jgi:hypothetical protein